MGCIKWTDVGYRADFKCNVWPSTIIRATDFGGGLSSCIGRCYNQNYIKLNAKATGRAAGRGGALFGR